MQQTWDYIVIGAGSAGCALAARLAEDPSIRVCLLEAGDEDRHPLIKVPAAFFAVLSNPRLNWNFATVPQPGLDGRSIRIPRGKVIGGSGAINGMVYFRGQPADFDGWAASGAAGWSYAEVLPYFQRQERVIHVQTVAEPNPLNALFAAALEGLGSRPCADFNGPDPEGHGLRQVMVHEGQRDSTARSMLHPARRRGNLQVITAALVARLQFAQRRVTGVVLADGRVLAARREVVLTAGAIGSPQLLLRSGVGPAGHLRELGIAVVHDLPGVGGNLQDHVACPVHVDTRDTTSFGISWRTLPRNAGALLRYLATRRGPLASNGFESAAFLRSHPGVDRPDIQLVFQVARRPNPRFLLPTGHGYAISPVSLYPHSRGTLRLASTDPGAPPRIDPQLLSDPRDLAPLRAALRLARQVLQQPAFARLEGREVAPGADVVSDPQLEAYIRANAYTIHHPCSTCRMGEDPLSVVDSSLRVRGIEALRVADASVFPRIIGGNTNAAVIMIAEKAGDLLRGLPPLPPAAPRNAVPEGLVC